MTTVDFSKLFTSVPETPQEIEATVDGTIPNWLQGTLLKNGPGIFGVGPDTYNHWFDGLAILQSFRISQGKVFFRSKHLRSETYEKCMKSNRIVCSEFGTTAQPDPRKSKLNRYASNLNPFSTLTTDNDLVNFIKYGDQIFAATETTLLNQIDPHTLDIIHKVDMRKFVNVNVETAHPHYDQFGNVFNIGAGGGAYKVFVTPYSELFRQPKNTQGLARTKILASIPTKRSWHQSYFHSFALTENFVIFLELPLVLSVRKLVFGAKWSKNSVLDTMEWRKKQKVIFHIVRIHDGSTVKRKYTTEPFFSFHHVNAYEQENCLIIDLIANLDQDALKIMNDMRLENLRAKNSAPKPISLGGKFCRVILPLSIHPNEKPGENLLRDKNFAGGATAILNEDGSVHCSILEIFPEKYVEFPQINYDNFNGQIYRYCYCIGRSQETKFPFDQLIKFDLQTRHVVCAQAQHRGDFVHEPIFVPRPVEQSEIVTVTEDDGILLMPVSNVLNDQLNRLVILDAKSLDILATASMQKFLAFGFHGLFVGSAAKNLA